MEYELIQKRMCMTKDIGVQDNLFGGVMLAWLDECGAVYASEKIGSKSVVTAHIDQLNFKFPVKSHDIVHIYGTVIRQGETSLTVELKAEKHDPYSREQKLVCSTKMVFVHIDEHGKPSKIN